MKANADVAFRFLSLLRKATDATHMLPNRTLLGEVEVQTQTSWIAVTPQEMRQLPCEGNLALQEADMQSPVRRLARRDLSTWLPWRNSAGHLSASLL